ncbi:MAG: hypothetical protein SRB2_00069 [Desulfobacteraceae bacterium Eth-SRB2]|nr:MAG: hypothetical protein SRB2_00069 [Desulfobacteraceae bacterium Eth-SRB2]
MTNIVSDQILNEIIRRIAETADPLKALLLFHKIPFGFVHDIAELLTVLKQNGISFSEEIRKAAELSDYAVKP